MQKSILVYIAYCMALAQNEAQTPKRVDVTRVGSQITLTWDCVPGTQYNVYTTPSLAAPWSLPAPQTQPLVATGHVLSWSTETLDENGFYRILERPGFVPSNMVWIWPGSVLMGTPLGVGPSLEQGETWVTLTRGFWMGIHEVTQGEYESATGENFSFFNGDRTGATLGGGLVGRDYGYDPRRPVEWVNWAYATNYCGLHSQWEREAGRLPDGWIYRLPTEAEWEYACRAGTTTQFSHGDDPDFAELDAYAWYGGSGVDMTSPVGLKLPNPWGLYDMHGNVAEWCLDMIMNYPGGTVVDLQGELAGWMVRGGDYGSEGFACGSGRRLNLGAHTATRQIGFRVVLAQDHP